MSSDDVKGVLVSDDAGLCLAGTFNTAYTQYVSNCVS
jgi:hypothetical protein